MAPVAVFRACQTRGQKSVADMLNNHTIERKSLVWIRIVKEMGSIISFESRNGMILWDGSKGSSTILTVKNCPTMMEGAT
eukprot:11922658-Ditylum_brightwellii.AAC.1